MKKILFVHSGNDLYGSGRMLLKAINIARTTFQNSKIEIWLPKSGDLSELLEMDFPDVKVQIVSLAILRKHDLKRFDFSAIFKLLLFPLVIKKLKKYDLIIVNTIVIWDILIALRFVYKAKLVYVHEMPLGLILKLTRLLLNWSKANLLFVSYAAKKNLVLDNGSKSMVIWNTCSEMENDQTEIFNTRNNQPINLLLIGRLSEMKGQRFLLNSILLLSSDLRSKLKIRFVGDLYGKNYKYKDELIGIVNASEMKHQVDFISFTSNPTIHYLWSNMVIIPSLLPESFGLVAIEAMSAGKPVIAANHGGLTEIVQHDVTGLLVTPGDARSLASAIERLCSSPSEREAMGAAGKARYEAYFTETKYAENFKEILSNIANKEAL